jgi:hypothetical protein
MKGQAGRRQLHVGRDVAGRQALRATAHQQTKHLQAVFVGERAQGSESIGVRHNSTLFELSNCFKHSESQALTF